MSAAMQKRPRSAFSPAVIIGVILVGVFSFGAFLVLSAFEPDLSSGRDGRAHALSVSAVGFAGAVRLARATGAPVSIGRTVASRDRSQSLVIVSPEQPITWADLQGAQGVQTLIILPKWAVTADPVHRGWVARLDALPPEAITLALNEIAPDTQLVRRTGTTSPGLSIDKTTTAGAIETLQTISGPALSAVVTTETGEAIILRLFRDGVATNVYVLSDPDFLNTQGIADLDNARAGLALLNLLRPEQEPIIFDVTMNGLGGGRSALRLAFEPPFLGATLGLVIAAALLGWRAALRFGPSAPVQRAIALGKQTLADNSAALIRLSGREHKLGPGYARLTGAAVTEAAGFGRKDEADALALLDRLSEAQGASATFTQLTADAAAAKTPQQMLEAARRLHAWKEEVARATG